jgi:5-carboxyvanillate decarboxylase
VRYSFRENSDEVSYLRIAAEEAFAPPELLHRYQELLAGGGDLDPGFLSLWGHYLGKSAQATALVSRIQDLDARRLSDMNDSGIARQILSLTAPGVQVFERDTAVGLARSLNDQLAEATRKHPGRFSGLAAVAPQDPHAAARELERGVQSLGLKGAIINSHTRGEYLDDQKFWPIFEAAAALKVPVYLHPTTPPRAMIRPFAERGLAGAIFGFGVETGLHMLRLVTSGVFDRFPELQVAVGHLGEALPYWMFRIDFMHGAMVASGRHAAIGKLQRKPSDYLKENFYYTTSGMAWEPVILFAQSVLGIDRVLYAMDYPYQYLPEEVYVTDNLPISDLDKLKFYQLNAEKVFGL